MRKVLTEPRGVSNDLEQPFMHFELFDFLLSTKLLSAKLQAYKANLFSKLRISSLTLLGVATSHASSGIFSKIKSEDLVNLNNALEQVDFQINYKQ